MTNKFPSEESGLPAIREIKEFEHGILPHLHDGFDGSQKIDTLNIVNKESVEGGKYVDSNTKNSISIDGAWEELTDLSASKEIVSDKRFLIILSGSLLFVGAGGCQIEIKFNIDTVDTATLATFLDNDGELNGNEFPFSIHYITASLTPATHAFKVYGRSTVGGGELVSSIFSVIELTS